MNPILAGTALENVSLHSLDHLEYATSMEATRMSTEGAAYAHVYEIVNAQHAPLHVPGVVVVGLDEEYYDETCNALIPTTVYWVIAGSEMFECSVHAGTNLRLGRTLGWCDLAAAAGEWSTSLAGIRTLAAAGGVANPESVLERLELLDMELAVYFEGPHL